MGELQTQDSSRIPAMQLQSAAAHGGNVQIPRSERKFPEVLPGYFRAFPFCGAADDGGGEVFHLEKEHAFGLRECPGVFEAANDPGDGRDLQRLR